MKLRDRYLALTMAKGTGIALLLIMGSSVIFSVIRRTDELDEGSYGISKMLRYVALMLLSPMFFIAQSTRRFQDWGSRWSTKSMNRQGCPVK